MITLLSSLAPEWMNEEDAMQRCNMQTSPGGQTFRTNACADIEVPVMEPNLWRVSVFGSYADGRRRDVAIDWTKSTDDDRPFDLMTIAEVGYVVDKIVARVIERGDTVRSAQAIPTFTADGRWCWSGRELTKDSAAYAAWLRACELCSFCTKTQAVTQQGDKALCESCYEAVLDSRVVIG